MSKMAARFTLADIARATRAAKQEGAAAVDVLPNGTIRVVLHQEDKVKPEAEAEKPKIRDFKL
jgi:hypothetical protein